jgi:spermidine synthase
MFPSISINRYFAMAIAVAFAGTGWLFAAQPTSTGLYGPIEKEVQSDYSHIQVRKKGNTRTLMFVRDNGEEVVETMVNLDRPYDMLIDYTRSMFLSYAQRPEQKKVLIVGLGGGSMIDFLQKYDPQLNIDVVEIDPAIIDVADKYFNIRAGEKLKIIKSDGLKYLAETPEKYDVIYMDAFLKPSADTDVNGVPLALKTDQFYKQMQQKLTPGGLVVFNLNPHAGSRDDIAGIVKAFPQTYVYRLARGEGFVVVGATVAERQSQAVITRQAADADRHFKASFSLENLSKTLQR